MTTKKKAATRQAAAQNEDRQQIYQVQGSLSTTNRRLFLPQSRRIPCTTKLHMARTGRNGQREKGAHGYV